MVTLLDWFIGGWFVLCVSVIIMYNIYEKMLEVINAKRMH